MKERLHLMLLFFALLSCHLVTGQSAKDLVDKADRAFSRKDYPTALEAYLSILKENAQHPEANFRAGICLLHGDRKGKAATYLETAFRLDPNIDRDIDYHLGMAYQNSHQYSKAIEHYNLFASKNRKLADVAQQKVIECQIGDSLQRHPAYVKIENLGNQINTAFHEYSPLLTHDGGTLVFTSNRSTNDYDIKSGTNFEDIYITQRNGQTWSSPQLISSNINIRFNDAAAFLSADGNALLLYYEDGAGDIYSCKRTDKGWSKPEPLNRNINTPLHWETSACMSADGKRLFFTSNRPGGEGELDIYVSELDANGEWGKAVNLGPTINTPLHEDSPFIHADGVTLYFSSDGHPTMGSNDIFRSEFVDGQWTKPVNLGYPINSVEYDGFFTISENKKTGYYSAFRDDGFGSADIYKITFLDPPPKQEEPVLVASTVVEPQVESSEKDYVDPIVQLHKDMKIVTVLKGKVIDEKTAAPIGATITLVDNGTRNVIARMRSNTETGDFELVIPHGGNYGVSTEKNGYLFNSINFNVPQFAEYQEIDTHILMVKAEVGSKVVLKNIFFDVGRADIKNESVAELENIRELLDNNSALKVQINGHTDNTGTSAANMVLSLKRAESVVNYLVSNGIDASRLSARGFGSERPIVSNDDEVGGREINRRTEIEILDVGAAGY